MEINYCTHKNSKNQPTIIGGYEGGYDLTWCTQCGRVAWCSDGLIPDVFNKNKDHSKWLESHLEAYGCRKEAASGQVCCKVWCRSRECVASIK